MTSCKTKELLGTRTSARWYVAVAAILCGCMPAMTYKSACRHIALVEASVMYEAGFRTRIAVGDTADGQRHATGQVFINGEWVDVEFWDWYVLPSRKREIATTRAVYSLKEWAAVLERSGWRVE